MTPCDNCGTPHGLHELKRGWTMALYCSARCERNAVSALHAAMPGNRLPHQGYVPDNIAREIQQRWEGA